MWIGGNTKELHAHFDPDTKSNEPSLEEQQGHDSFPFNQPACKKKIKIVLKNTQVIILLW